MLASIRDYIPAPGQRQRPAERPCTLTGWQVRARPVIGLTREELLPLGHREVVPDEPAAGAPPVLESQVPQPDDATVPDRAERSTVWAERHVVEGPLPRGEI